MLTYNLNERGTLTLYEYVYKCIKDDIVSGKIKTDEKLPSKRNMAKNHDISVITVENAYAQLLVEGYIRAVEKKGYFANEITNQISENQEVTENVSEYKINKPEKVKWIVDFNSNHVRYDSFPFATWSKIMRQKLLDEENSFLMTPSRNGIWELRSAIAKHLREFRGLTVLADQIIVGAGTEYLYGLIVQLLGRDSVIATENPGYRKISMVYESNGVRTIHLPMDNQGISIDELEKSDANIVHISPNHHFPTGKVMPAARRHQLLEWANMGERYIIEDDYDSEFRFSGKPIPTMASIDKNQKVIYMNTFSKTLAPSIRIAYMVLPFELMDKYTKKLDFYSSTVSSFEQYTLAEFIKGGYYERHINRMRNYYKDSRNKIITAIRNSSIYPQISIEEENSGLHFILRIKKNIDDENFKKYLKDKLINISCLTDYCYQYDDEVINEKFRKEFSHKFIINYSEVEESKMVEALKIIEQALKFTAEKDT